jgi:O-antigen/teichoic acid export membrane protein
MNIKPIIPTIFSRISILIIGFGLVMFTTHIWGSSGRGAISLLLADLVIVCFFANIVVGSSISYYASRLPFKKLLTFAYVWCFLVSLLIPLVLQVFHNQEHIVYLMLIAFLFSVLTAHIHICVGLQHMAAYNMYTFLQYALLALFLGASFFLVDVTNVTLYFVAQIVTYLLLCISSFYTVMRIYSSVKITLEKNAETFFSLFSYGWKIELSGFLQFLNNRLAFYVLAAYSGIASVGVFSVGVACAEAFLIISKSFSIHVYAQTVATTDVQTQVVATKTYVKAAFYISILGFVFCAAISRIFIHPHLWSRFL